jgi:septal ring factor EnvC (AmiA/AmiB activator)
MKRFLGILSAAVILAACNNAGDSTEEVQDSVMEKIDSTGEARVDSVKEATDSLQEKVENTFEKTDSANKEISETAEGNKNEKKD